MSVLEFFNTSFLISCAHSHDQLISVISEYLILLKGEILLSIFPCPDFLAERMKK